MLCSVLRNQKKWVVQCFSARNAAGSSQGRSMCRGWARNIISTACGEDISSNFAETALLCDAVGCPRFFWGAGLASNALKKPSDLHGGTVCEAEGGEPSSRQRLMGILPKVWQKRCHFVVPWGGCYPGWEADSPPEAFRDHKQEHDRQQVQAVMAAYGC